MENVTDRVADPFDMDPPCDRPCEGAPAVLGYGDANADVHVVGDHPSVHGGAQTGVPFTDHDAGRALLSVLEDVSLLELDDAGVPIVSDVDVFLSYLHPCCPGPTGPTPASYARLDPTFDAELRAVGAHVLVPVGDRPFAHVLREYTARADRVRPNAAAHHATELRGRGWLVVPVADPTDWGPGDRTALVDRLTATLASDYRQTADLSRFRSGGEDYLVR